MSLCCFLLLKDRELSLFREPMTNAKLIVLVDMHSSILTLSYMRVIISFSSIPSGLFAVLAAVFCTFAVALTWTTQRSCHFLDDVSFIYCPAPDDPENAYGCCGDCYCINGNEECPTKVPNMNISTDTIAMFQSMTPTNPYNLTCNPFYAEYSCGTTPPQNFTDLGDTAVCGIFYDLGTLDANQCPTQYSLESFPDEASAEANGATLTHYGACGVCSTTQDLASYIEQTDLMTLGVECSREYRSKGFEAGVLCFQQKAGLSRACAEMWVYTSGQTRDYCRRSCFSFRVRDRPSNGPAPQCVLDECLICEKLNTLPLFDKVAARTPRRSGLLGKIARPCENILFVDHQNPCDVVQGISREFEQGDVCQVKEEVEEEPCTLVARDLGLRSYEKPGNGNFLDFEPRRSDDSIYDTVYGKCSRYNFRNAQDGFWRDVESQFFGSVYVAAVTCGMIAAIIGTFMWIFLLTSFCVAYPKNFWLACVALFALCGSLEVLTLLFFVSNACNNGCTMGYAAYCAIAAGIMWFVTAGLCWKTAAVDEANPYTPVAFDIVITEYAQADGTVLTEKMTTRSNGTSVIERTRLIKRGQDEKEGMDDVGVTENAHSSVHVGIKTPATSEKEAVDAPEDSEGMIENTDDDVDMKKYNK